jgi:hypothetical protein
MWLHATSYHCNYALSFLQLVIVFKFYDYFYEYGATIKLHIHIY